MDPLSTLTAIMQLVSNAYSVSRELYQLVDAIRNAPTHITAMAQDIQSLYLVLGSLQGLLADLQKLSPLPGILPILESLQQPLSHCLFALDQLQQKLDKYSRPASDGKIRMRKWTAFRWQFTEKDALFWRENLLSYKLTLDIAVATANL